MKIITEKMIRLVEVNQCPHCLIGNDTACYEPGKEIGCARYKKATMAAVYDMICSYIKELNAWGDNYV